MDKQIQEVISVSVDVSLGDKTYILSPMDIADYCKFQKWCQKELQKEIIEVNKLLDQKTTKEELLEASADDEFCAKMMHTFEGIKYLIYLSISRNSDDITLQEVEKHLTIDKMQELSEVLYDGFLEQPTEVVTEEAGEVDKKKELT